jgi:hypothetical protein
LQPELEQNRFGQCAIFQSEVFCHHVTTQRPEVSVLLFNDILSKYLFVTPTLIHVRHARNLKIDTCFSMKRIYSVCTFSVCLLRRRWRRRSIFFRRRLLFLIIRTHPRHQLVNNPPGRRRQRRAQVTP